MPKKHAELEEIVKAFELYKTMLRELAENQELAKDPDPELCEMALAEIAPLKARIGEQERELKQLLTPGIPWMKRTSSSRFAPGLAGRRRPCSSPTCSECIRGMPSCMAGASRC